MNLQMHMHTYLVTLLQKWEPMEKTVKVVGFLQDVNVRSIRSVTTCLLRCVFVNSTWSTRRCLSKDIESSPGVGKGSDRGCVIPGLFFWGDFLGLFLDFPLSTGVL